MRKKFPTILLQNGGKNARVCASYDLPNKDYVTNGFYLFVSAFIDAGFFAKTTEKGKS